MGASQINGGARRRRDRAAAVPAQRLARGAAVPRVREDFSEDQLASQTLAVVAINGWNRLAIAFRAEAGRYQPGMLKRPKAA